MIKWLHLHLASCHDCHFNNAQHALYKCTMEEDAATQLSDVFPLIQAAISEILVKLGTAIIHFLPTLTFGTLWKLCLIV